MLADLVYVGVLVFTGIGAIAATLYYIKRISIEKERSETMRQYYVQMLAIEREKVAVEKEKLARRNGP